MNRWLRALAACVVLSSATGCAGSVVQWIAATRNHQGDIALLRGNDPDAATAYELALKIDPRDAHARTGFVTVQLRIAEKLFTDANFTDALEALSLAAKYSPDDERIAALRLQIEQAQIKREIVVSNYPSYKESTTSIRRSFVAVRRDADAIAKSVARFEYTYDTDELTEAIRQSIALRADLARTTARLQILRQLAESGASEAAGAPAIAPPASLLPLP